MLGDQLAREGARADKAEAMVTELRGRVEHAKEEAAAARDLADRARAHAQAAQERLEQTQRAAQEATQAADELRQAEAGEGREGPLGAAQTGVAGVIELGLNVASIIAAAVCAYLWWKAARVPIPPVANLPRQARLNSWAAMFAAIAASCQAIAITVHLLKP
jgi:hypothetical protein